MKNRTDHDVEKAMSSFEGINRPEAPHFLLGKVMYGLQNRQPITFWDRISAQLTRPSVAIATIAIVIAVNVVFLAGKEANPASNLPAEESAATLFTLFDLES